MDEHRRIIDPSKAYIDLDALSLESFSVHSSTAEELGGVLAAPLAVTVTAVLKGGLGKITGPTGEAMRVDRLEELEITSIYLSIDDEHLTIVQDLLQRWGQLGILLRFVDFGDHALLLEDGDHVIVLPAGQRNVHAQGWDG